MLWLQMTHRRKQRAAAHIASKTVAMLTRETWQLIDPDLGYGHLIEQYLEHLL